MSSGDMISQSEVNFPKASTDSGSLCHRAILIVQLLLSVVFGESKGTNVKKWPNVGSQLEMIQPQSQFQPNEDRNYSEWEMSSNLSVFIDSPLISEYSGDWDESRALFR
jgi:hypothetical protein